MGNVPVWLSIKPYTALHGKRKNAQMRRATCDGEGAVATQDMSYDGGGAVATQGLGCDGWAQVNFLLAFIE